MSDLPSLSAANLARLRAEVRRELDRIGALPQGAFAQALARRRAEVGAEPPLGLTTTIAGLAAILEHGSLFTMWDVAAGRVRMPAQASALGVPSVAQWKPDQRRVVEDGLALVLADARAPVYAALASERGEDRAAGGMFVAGYGPATLELGWRCAACFHWGDSFDAIDDARGRFEPAWCIGPGDAREAKALLDVVRGINFPIVGRTDFARDHARIGELIHLGRVTPLFLEALILDPPSLATAGLVVRTGGLSAQELGLLERMRPRLAGAFARVSLA